MLEIERDHDEIISISLNGEHLRPDDGETWFLPKGLVKDTTVDNLPSDAVFEVCSRIEDTVVILDTIPVRIQKIADNKVQVGFDDSGTRKYWDGTIGFKPYMEAKKAIVEERATEVGDGM